MARRYANYDPQKELLNTQPVKPLFSTMEIIEQEKKVKRMWLDTFECDDYDDTLMRFTVEGIWKDIIQAGADFSEGSIREAMAKFIDRDDWAYILAYGKERVYPPVTKSSWSKYRKRKRKQTPGQVRFAI